MTPMCEVVQYVPHPARDGGVSLCLGDQVAQQGAGAQEAQADVGGLREVSQRRRVGEVFGPRPTVDQGHHDLDNTYSFHKDCFSIAHTIQRLEYDVLPLRSPKGQSVSILWCRAGRHHVLHERWAAFQTFQYTHALNLPEKIKKT